MSVEGTAPIEKSAPWTVKRVLEWTIGYLKQHGSDSPRLDAEVLLSHVRGCPRIKLYTDYETPLSDDERARMRELVKRRAEAEPVAYLVGYREFFSLRFAVGPGVLIPRPDTETLVMAALDIAKTRIGPTRILDLCTGSGCIAVAIAKNHPRAELTAIDLDAKALKFAEQNIQAHDVGQRIKLLAGDLFAPLSGNERFDIIVSNPPYVSSSEIPTLDADVRNHEPLQALDGGPDGLDIIRRIVNEAPAHLANDGILMFEISPEQALAATSIMTVAGYVDAGLKKDLSGQARVVQGRKPEMVN